MCNKNTSPKATVPATITEELYMNTMTQNSMVPSVQEVVEEKEPEEEAGSEGKPIGLKILGQILRLT